MKKGYLYVTYTESPKFVNPYINNFKIGQHNIHFTRNFLFKKKSQFERMSIPIMFYAYFISKKSNVFEIPFFDK